MILMSPRHFKEEASAPVIPVTRSVIQRDEIAVDGEIVKRIPVANAAIQELMDRLIGLSRVDFEWMGEVWDGWPRIFEAAQRRASVEVLTIAPEELKEFQLWPEEYAEEMMLREADVVRIPPLKWQANY
jgi:hypothetical protein